MKNLISYIFLCLFTLSLISLPSCTTKRTKEYHYKGKIIPKGKFIQFLIDLHKTDAILINIDAWDKNLERVDSLSYYNYLLKKYKINFVDFQRTLAYYFDNLDELQKIYKIVVDSLKKRQTILDSIQRQQMRRPNLWVGKQYYFIPFHDSPKDSIPFKIKNPAPGIYELSADIMVYDDDQTFGLRMLMMTKFENDSIDSSYTQIYFKDSQFHRYITKITVPDTPKAVQLFGKILDYKNSIYMHIKIRRIRLVRYDLDNKDSKPKAVKSQH